MFVIATKTLMLKLYILIMQRYAFKANIFLLFVL